MLQSLSRNELVWSHSLYTRGSTTRGKLLSDDINPLMIHFNTREKLLSEYIDTSNDDILPHGKLAPQELNPTMVKRVFHFFHWFRWSYGENLEYYWLTDQDQRALLQIEIVYRAWNWDVIAHPYPAFTRWGRVTHKCVSKLSILGSDNGLSPFRRQAII